MRLPKLTKANYYSPEMQRIYWSASKVKQFAKCPACAAAMERGEYSQPMSSALLIGSYVDAFFDGRGEFDAFVSKHPEIFSSRTGELKKEFQHADVMIQRAQSDPVFMAYLRGQRQKIFTGEIGGFPFKCKMDFYKKGEFICDLKTVKDMNYIYIPGTGRVSPIEAHGWDLQLAIYAHLEGNDLPAYLAIITKETPPCLYLIEVEKYRREACLDYLRTKLPLWDAMLMGVIEPERCERCPWCRQTKKITKPITLDEMIGD